MQLVYTETNVPVETGDIVDLRDGKVVVEYVKEPHKPSSTGRVGVKYVESKWTMEYFPIVIGAEWKTTDQLQFEECGWQLGSRMV
jgi:hypothetical protein